MQANAKVPYRRALKTVVFSILILGLLFSAGQVVFSSGNAVESILFYDADNTFMDLYNPISFAASANPYENSKDGAMYPPLAYMLYRNLGRALKPYVYTDDPFTLRDLQCGRMLTLLVTLSGMLPLIYLFYRKYRGRDGEKLLFIACMLLSSPYLYLVERGNNLIWVIWLLLLFVLGYRSRNKWVRELSLISLAVAFALKLYPAVFGLLLLIDKQYRSAIRCSVYAIVLLIVPLFYFNGISTLNVFIFNLQHSIQATVSGVCRVDWHTTLASWFVWFGNSEEAGLQTAASLTVPLLIVLGAAAFLFKPLWKRCLCITLIATLIPSFNFYYVIVLMMIPLFLLLQSEKYDRKDIAYAALMALMLMLFLSPAGREIKLVGFRLLPLGGYPTYWNIELCKFCLLCSVLLIGTDACIQTLGRWRRRGVHSVPTKSECAGKA